jgi:hypothetical protein
LGWCYSVISWVSVAQSLVGLVLLSL